MTDTRQRRLTLGLVGDDHADLYQTSPTFRMAIDTLAGFLPFMVNGLAAQADKEDTSRAAVAEQLMRDMARPVTGVFIDGVPHLDRPTPAVDAPLGQALTGIGPLEELNDPPDGT